MLLLQTMKRLLPLNTIPAIESAHAVAYAMKLAPTLPKDKIIVICLSGRGDKDVAAIARYKGVDLHD
jgi:tryptophan synthase beta chain